MAGTMAIQVSTLGGYGKPRKRVVTLPLVSALLDQPDSRYFMRDAAVRPEHWTAAWVKLRTAEAFEIERRIPGGRVGPAAIGSSWPGTVDSFSDRVAQGETARADVWRAWARSGGATPQEVTRMEEALAWPGAILANGRAFEGRCLLLWAHAQAGGPPLTQILATRGLSRATFYRHVTNGATRIARALEARGLAVC